MISRQWGALTVLAYGNNKYHFKPRTPAGVYVRLRVWRWVLEVEA